jgi:hypothetical protein
MGRPASRWRPPQFTIIVRWVGLAIAIYETVVERVDRPSLLILAGGMMGLHSVWKAQNGD